MKSILITGVSSGIGEALASFYSDLGWTVVGTVRKEADGEKLMAQFPNNFHPIVYDVRDIENIDVFHDDVASILDNNGLDVLINNAGIAVGGPLECVSEGDFEMQLDINVKAVRRIINSFLPLMVNHLEAAKIINISSISGFMTYPMLGPYCISKHALEALIDAYRRELIPFNIDVISIQPGPIITPIWKKTGDVYEQYKSSRYAPFLNKIKAGIAKSLHSALPASAVVDAVNKSILAKKPKTRYIVAKNPYILKILKNLIPDKWIDNEIKKSIFNMPS